MKLNKRLQNLKKRGCSPSIYLRGNIWRAHVNRSGNFWDEHEDPCQALERAVSLWVKKGCPMDGEHHANNHP